MAFAISCAGATSTSLTLAWSDAPAGTIQVNFAVTGVGNQNAGQGTSPIVYDGLAVATAYTVIGEARDLDGAVLATDTIACATEPALVVAADVTDTTSVDLSWGDIAGAASYEVTIYLDADDSVVQTLTISTTSHAAYLVADTAYWAEVVARDGLDAAITEGSAAWRQHALSVHFLSRVTPSAGLGTWAASPVSVDLTVPNAGTDHIDVRLPDPGVTVVSWRVFVLTYDTLPGAVTYPEPITEAHPPAAAPDFGFYFGAVTPSLYPMTLVLGGLESATFYAVLVHGLNASGEIVVVGSGGKTTT